MKKAAPVKKAAPAKKAVVAKKAAPVKKAAPAPKHASRKAKKVLVTGANGFIGSYLADHLHDLGLEVIAPVRPGSNKDRLAHTKATVIDLDVNDADALHDLLKDIDIVFHVAAAIKAPNDEAFEKANVELPVKLAHAAMKANPNLHRFLFISSLAATGPSLGQLPRAEDAPNNPTTPYGKSKLRAEHALNAIKGLPLTTIRPPAVMGAGDDATFPVFQMVNTGFSFGVLGIDRRYSFIDVRDLVRGIAEAALNPKGLGEIFHVTHEATFSLEESQKLIAEALGKKTVIPLRIPESILVGLATLAETMAAHNMPYLPFDKTFVSNLTDHSWIGDPAHIRETLGFEATITLAQCVQDAADGYKTLGKL